MLDQAATLAETDGILAVVMGVLPYNGIDDWLVESAVGDSAHISLLCHTLQALDSYPALPPGDNVVRLTAGDHTYLVQREGNRAAGVVFPTGHPCAKSIRRTIRRMARRSTATPTPKRNLASPVHCGPVRPPENTDPGPVAGGV